MWNFMNCKAAGMGADNFQIFGIPHNPEKNFPDFLKRDNPYRKTIENDCCQGNNNNSNGNTKKKRKRRRRRRRNKRSEPPRQRHISVQSEDSLIVFDQNSEESSEIDSLDLHPKKVRFAEVLCEVHPMIMWSYAYQAARKGPWEELALDRCRFKDRITRIDAVISPVLNRVHRSRVYQERFMDSA